MAKPNLLTTKTSHFIVSLFTLVFLVYLQACLLAKSSSLWLHIDLVTIAVIYVSIQHFLPLALIKILFTALLLQANSAVPNGFYIMYFLLIIVFSKILSKLFIFSSYFGQFFIFLILLSLKLLLFYFTIQNRDFLTVSGIFLISWKGFIISLIISLPLFKILSIIDSYFEYIPSHDKKKIIDL